MKNYAVQLLTKMLEIYSPSGKEESISSFLADEMKKLGFNVRQDNVGNVIGETGRGSTTILLCGHMDTIAGFIPVQERNNKLYGRGAVDAKASLAAMIVASSSLMAYGPAGKIVVAGVVDEEGQSRGIKNLLKEGIKADYAIFGEPSGVEKVTVGYKGLLRLKITCKTETGHSAANILYENAVEKAFEIWNEIKKFHFPSDKPESPFYSITSSLTKIKGGKGNSTIPSSCQIQVDIRVPPQLTTTQIFEGISKLIEQYKRANPKVSVKAKVKDAIEPFEADSKSFLVRALSKSIREVRHRTATLMRKTGTGDMNIFGRIVKIPVVTYGPGDPTLSHTEKEHIDLQEYVDSIEVYQRTIKRIFNMHKEST
ncbi:MAG: M20/M25/M40 family metallo-hydrolase [Nitrososphaerota archaeon]|nr:M20/M25/M40 family metallo-hydrolase [Candidatus Bathyarchaeota archaeon]MDW8022327.1 M20/M25/M40 family metallo-hydrolase [Nitrososphaerota archaeon]